MKKISFMLVLLLVMQFSMCVFAENTDLVKVFDTADNTQLVKVDNQLAEAVADLKALGILKGDENGDIRTDDFVTRAEAAAMLVRANGLDAEAVYDGVPKFEDIKNHWSVKDVSAAAMIGITNGTTATTFSPDRDVTIQELVKMTVCLLGYGEMAEQRGGYPHGYIQTAMTYGLLKGINAEAAAAKREDVIKILANALDTPLMVQIGFGSVNEFAVMDGKDGREFLSLRKKVGFDESVPGEAPEEMTEETTDGVPRFNGEEYTNRLVQIKNLKKSKSGYSFENSLNDEDKATYIVNDDTYVDVKETTLELDEIKNGLYAFCWHYTDDEGDIELLKIELLKKAPQGIEGK